MSNFLSSFLGNLSDYTKRFIFMGNSDYAKQIAESIEDLKSQVAVLSKPSLFANHKLKVENSAQEKRVFESWVKSVLGESADFSTDETGNYQHPEINAAWLAWNARVTQQSCVKIPYAKLKLTSIDNGMPDCPKCGNNRQVWRNQITNKLTCHRAYCNIVIEEMETK